MVIVFPPGDIFSIEIDEEFLRRSLWREFSLAFHLIKQTVNPEILLSDCIAQWKEISRMLSEKPRNRKNQFKYLYL